MAKHRGGGRRPIEYSSKMARIVLLQGAHVSKNQLAPLLGMATATLNSLFERSLQLRKDWAYVNASMVKEVHNKHIELCLAGDVPSIKLFLQSKHPDYRPAAMVSVENTIQNKSTEILYRPTIHRYDGSVDPETPEPDDVEAGDEDLEEIWDTNEDESPKSLKELQMQAASREMEQASLKAEDLAAIFL